jgi:hypothetical protein
MYFAAGRRPWWTTYWFLLPLVVLIDSLVLRVLVGLNAGLARQAPVLICPRCGNSFTVDYAEVADPCWQGPARAGHTEPRPPVPWARIWTTVAMAVTLMAMILFWIAGGFTVGGGVVVLVAVVAAVGVNRRLAHPRGVRRG